MANDRIKLGIEPIRELAFSGISGTYAAVGDSLGYPTTMVLIQNATDAALMLSFDAIDDNIYLPVNFYLMLDISANETTLDGFYICSGTTLYVKQYAGAPTTGSVFITPFYARN